MTIRQQIAALKADEITPLQLLEDAIARIEQNNPTLNAVVHTRFSEARREAQSKDFRSLPLAGMPVLIKALGQPLRGFPDTQGSRLFKDHQAIQTSLFVQKIQDLGGIILGATNTPEFGLKNTTDALLYGPCRLFGHLEAQAGGSSGGAAAAIKSGMVSIASASDGGGSIRIPASYHGLIGLKPTRGTMPVGPQGYRGWQGASVPFFITRNMDDTALLFSLMHTEQPEAPFMNRLNPGKTGALKIARQTRSFLDNEVSEEAKYAVERTIDHLQQLGHHVEDVTLPIDGLALMHSYYVINGAEMASFAKQMGSFDRSLLEPVSLALIDYGMRLDAASVVDALNQWDQASAQMHAFHKHYDVCLTPTTAYAAPSVSDVWQDEAMLQRMRTIDQSDNPYSVIWDMFARSLARTPYTMLANMTGQPAISLPMGQASDGRFIGIQLIAPKGDDATLLALGHQLEPYFLQ